MVANTMTNEANPLDFLHESPRHGDQGDRHPTSPQLRIPRSLTIAISRESGSRGTSIATRVGEKLGWQVYTQEFLEHISQQEQLRQEVYDTLSPEVLAWVDQKMEKSPMWNNPAKHPSTMDLLRVLYALGGQGEVVLIGRGAGLILPKPTTLYVRMVAPLEDRIAYTTQWLRMTQDEAVEQVRIRDQRRTEFIETNYHRSPSDVHQYDLVLNTSYLGEELCADIMVHAAKEKLASLHGESSDESSAYDYL